MEPNQAKLDKLPCTALLCNEPNKSLVLKKWKNDDYTLYNNKKINQPMYKKDKLKKPFTFNDDQAVLPLDIIKNSKKK
jgi:hypothetical protein